MQILAIFGRVNIYIYINSLHGVAWQGVTTVGLVCIYAKFFEIVPT